MLFRWMIKYSTLFFFLEYRHWNAFTYYKMYMYNFTVDWPDNTRNSIHTLEYNETLSGGEIINEMKRDMWYEKELNSIKKMLKGFWVNKKSKRNFLFYFHSFGSFHLFLIQNFFDMNYNIWIFIKMFFFSSLSFQ